MSGSVERLESAVSNLVRVAGHLGCAFPLADHEQRRLLADVEAAIAPLELPSDIRHFYSTWSVAESGALFSPELTDLSFALDTWLENNATGWPSTVLFPIAYASHWFHFVELDHAGTVGPLVYDGAYAGGEFKLAFSCLADWLEWLTAEVEAGRVEEIWKGHWGPAEDRDVDDTAAALDRDGILATEPRTFDDSDRYQWPLRWNLADGFDPADYELRGATATLADFVAALRDGPASATIHCGVHSQFSPVTRIVDETGMLVAKLPRHDPPFGSGPIWEIDIEGEHQPDAAILPPPTPQPPPPPFDASRQDDAEYIAEYAALAARRMAPRLGEPVATVTILRPILIGDVAQPEVVYE